MKNKIMDPNKPVGRLTRVADFLPLPQNLVTPAESMKVTPSRSSARFLKKKRANTTPNTKK